MLFTFTRPLCCCDTENSPTVGLIKDYLIYQQLKLLAEKMYFFQTTPSKMHDRSEEKASCLPLLMTKCCGGTVLLLPSESCVDLPTAGRKSPSYFLKTLPCTYTVLPGVWEQTVSPLCSCLKKSRQQIPLKKGKTSLVLPDTQSEQLQGS